jgi:uncharacterized membrane protein
MSFHERDISFQKRLRQEIDIWLDEGIISLGQKKKILARYRVLEEADEKAGPGKLVTTISVLGAILVGIGIILFVASNWSEIPRWGKLFLIFAFMVTFYGLGFYLRYEKEDYPKVGAALIFLGSIVFGAGIFLIAQIYHITVHYPNGPLIWGLGVLPLAYLLRFRTILTLAIIDLLIWLAMESSFWLTESTFYGNVIPYITLFLLAGLALWSTGLMHRGFHSLRPISGPYIVIGMLLTYFSAYVLTFDIYRLKLGAFELVPFYAGIAGLFLISCVTYMFSREKEKAWLPEILSIAAVICIVLVLTLFYPGVSYDAGSFQRTANSLNLMTLISNLIFAVMIIGIIFLGYIRRYPAYINIGLLFFVLDVFARYFDFFWRLLPRSLFFIIGGVILLVGSVVLEKKRKRVLASFNIREAD